MDKFICIGKIINTFGIKGEVKIDSNFEYLDRVFVKDFIVYIGEEKIKESITTHRIHKGYHMVLFSDYKNINEVLKYKNKKIYILEKDLSLNKDEYLLDDLIGLDVYDDEKILGKVVDYEYNKNYVLLKVKGEKEFYLPKIDYYIKEVDLVNLRINTNKGSELIL